MTREQIVIGVKKWTLWWVKERQKKLIKQLDGTMSVNPFLMPFLFSFHDLEEFGDLANIMISAHLLTGHNTGFGKLIDEKILPRYLDVQNYRQITAEETRLYLTHASMKLIT